MVSSNPQHPFKLEQIHVSLRARFDNTIIEKVNKSSNNKQKISILNEYLNNKFNHECYGFKAIKNSLK